MGDTTDILILFGLGYLLYKVRKTGAVITKTAGELAAGTSPLYSPYTQRYFSRTHSRKGSIWRRLFG